MLAGLSGGAIGAAGGGAISFLAVSSKSCDFGTVAVVMVGATGGAIGLLVGARLRHGRTHPHENRNRSRRTLTKKPNHLTFTSRCLGATAPRP